jgi:hypothetical protein
MPGESVRLEAGMLNDVIVDGDQLR